MFQKAHLGTRWKSNPFGGASHAKGIVLEKVYVLERYKIIEQLKVASNFSELFSKKIKIFFFFANDTSRIINNLFSRIFLKNIFQWRRSKTA